MKKVITGLIAGLIALPLSANAWWGEDNNEDENKSISENNYARDDSSRQLQYEYNWYSIKKDTSELKYKPYDPDKKTEEVLINDSVTASKKDIEKKENTTKEKAAKPRVPVNYSPNSNAWGYPQGYNAWGYPGHYNGWGRQPWEYPPRWNR